MKMYISLTRDAFSNHFPMKPAVARQLLSKFNLVCSLEVSEQYIPKI